MTGQLDPFGEVAVEGAVIPRVRQIIAHEQAADALDVAADAHRWEAARLIAEELAAGKSQRQLAAEIGKSQTHVSRMARVWQARESLETQQPGAFNELYQALAAKPVPAAIEAPPTASADEAVIDSPETLTQRTARPDPLRRIIIGDILDAMETVFGPEAAAEVERLADEQEALIDAARRYLRYGVTDMPPITWKPVTPGSTPAKARGALGAERNRLGEWEIRVAYEVGKFLKWCESAGICIEGKSRARLVFPAQLTYPGEHMPADWGPDDEHAAALGHFYSWYYTRDELCEMTGAAS